MSAAGNLQPMDQFRGNPFNYVALAAAALKLFFRACYILYGKNNTLFAKKIAGTGLAWVLPALGGTLLAVRSFKTRFAAAL